jgi:hypothetical protein
LYAFSRSTATLFRSGRLTREPPALNISRADLREVLPDESLVSNVEEFCAPPAPAGEDGLPCSAVHSACYVSPYGDFHPCVQFATRQRQARALHRHLEAFAAEVRSSTPATHG